MSTPRADVLLLTKNGAAYLDESLTAVREQLGRSGGRVLAVDSGSSDDTLRILSRHGVAVARIAADSFQHGRTRNLIAGMTDPETKYLVFLTQDATPQPGWLEGLLSALESDASVAGAFSRHVPRPGCNPLLARRIREEWPQVGGTRRIVKSLVPGGDGSGDDGSGDEDAVDDGSGDENSGDVGPGGRLAHDLTHDMAHFSNTSSCIRRAVWTRLPFPEVDFAEDVAWARLALARGHGIVYEPSSCVRHSHSGSLWRQFAENVDHARGLKLALADGGRVALMPPVHGTFDRVRRDLEAIWRSETGLAARLGWTGYAPLWYAASAAGQWVGARADRWPAFVRAMLSHQASVARGGGS